MTGVSETHAICFADCSIRRTVIVLSSTPRVSINNMRRNLLAGAASGQYTYG